MQTRVLLGLGTGLAALAALPGYSQSSNDAALDAACRATEVTMPDSCPCTITKARAVGVKDSELASLFKDDGHSQPVAPAQYGKFWQVKSQCIADTMMASLGVTPGNPLPGVPANMRPGMPFPGAAPAPAAPPPPPQTARRAPAPAAAEPGAGGERTVLPGYDGGPPTVQITRQTPNFDYVFSYSQPIEAEPALLAMAQTASRATFDQVAPNYTSGNTSYRNEYYYGWSVDGTYGPLLSILKTGGDGSRGQRGFEGSLLWDSERDREIAWTDLFDSGVWNGLIRREYCAGLQAERRRRDAGQNTSCPGFDQLGIALGQGSDGRAQLAFTAFAYVAGSYAEGPYEVTIPLNDTMIASVQQPYRALFGASADASAAVALRDRLGEINGVIAGDIGASDDFYFITGGAESFTRVSQFARLFQQARPPLFMTIYEASDENWGYSIKLDGKQHNLVPSDRNLDYSSRMSSVRRYSDGTVTVTIEKGASITDNPAYGYSIDRITVTKGGETDTFRAINYGAV